MNIIYRLVYPILGAIILGLIIFLGFTLIQDQTADSDTQSDTTDDSNDGIVSTFSRSDVSQSSTRDNCMFILDGNVYEIPESYFDEHPGGANPILNSCGGDVSNVFDKVHKNPEGARADLAEFFVGTLEASELPDGVTISMDRVVAGDDINSLCLTIVNGSVYEIPLSWAQEHPGGFSEIAGLCGRDASSNFNEQHSGTSEALEQLEAFYIGELE